MLALIVWFDNVFFVCWCLSVGLLALSCSCVVFLCLFVGAYLSVYWRLCLFVGPYFYALLTLIFWFVGAYLFGLLALIVWFVSAYGVCLLAYFVACWRLCLALLVLIVWFVGA